MTACCAPACSQALPVKPHGVWARGIEAWARSSDLRKWSCRGGGLRALKKNWKLLQLQHDEAIRIVNETRKQAVNERKALKDASRNEVELSEAKLAIRLCTDKVRKSDRAERLARLTRDMDKRRTRAECTTAPGENRNNARGKPKSSFPKASGSNSRRNQNPHAKGGSKSRPISSWLWWN